MFVFVCLLNTMHCRIGMISFFNFPPRRDIVKRNLSQKQTNKKNQQKHRLSDTNCNVCRRGQELTGGIKRDAITNVKLIVELEFVAEILGWARGC